ncbi:hypothetical protein [Thermococcus sp. MAR1]|uniref:hypothetical protein n=1 Tax=Thermococcus sp. MAR1 TaxID=1638263 RepID=UPI00143AC356|nr:hypothetical protein [Thermococcus sp. MAR1]NJE09409.1 hypothetical protein [Thermococcus sp. MAR1]
MAYYPENGSKVSFSESFGAWPITGGSGYSVIDEWATQLGIAPPCHIQRGEVRVQIEKGALASHGMYLCHHNPNPTDSLREKCLKEYTLRTELMIPSGEVKIATFVVPIGEGRWKKTDMPFCGKALDLTSAGSCPPVTSWVNGTCSCIPEDILKTTIGSIESAGFKKREEVTVLETEALKPLYSALFVKNDQYLYVEFSEVKDMNLVRVLMIMGDEKTVKAYAEAFTAVGGGG